jgi:F0F1-type ATP synthase epsilon subunit
MDKKVTSTEPTASVKTTSVKPAKQKMSVKEGRLGVKVFSPYQTYYVGEAVSLSAANKTGPFDILVDHANFFSLITAGNVVVETGYAHLVFPVNHGVIKVTDNQVTVFIDV